MSEPGSLIRTLSGRQSARNYHSYVITEVGLGITSGKLSVGSILPNDAELMASYGVSRTVLREALKTLEAKGMVEARAKVGTRVLPRGRWNLFDRQILAWISEAGPDAAFLTSFIELRAPIEIQAATLAATRRSAEQLRMLLYWHDKRKAASTAAETYAMAEFELHRTLCDASQNPFLRVATSLAEFGVVQSVQNRIKADVTQFAAEKDDSYDMLVDAIMLQKTDQAISAMSAILLCDQQWIMPPAPSGA